MNKWSKVGLTVGMGASVVAATHVVNKLIFTSSVAKNHMDSRHRFSYSWKFGNISYIKKGHGKPLLLIHDLNSASSSYEWTKIIDSLSAKNQVYAIDLLGCGLSDKPNITYTAYMYTQMISDFIENVIKKKTSVIVSGDSAPLCVMTAYANTALFHKIILINPQNIEDAMQIPTKRSNLLQKIYNMPIFGTLMYNINMSRREIKNYFINKAFYNSSIIPEHFLEVYHESAHLSGANAKYLFSSINCHYTTVSITRALANMDHSIYIIYGNKEKNILSTINQYVSTNSAIETAAICNTRHLPQVERSHETMKYINLFLGD